MQRSSVDSDDFSGGRALPRARAAILVAPASVRQAAWMLAALQCVALAVVGLPAAARGYPLDDAWILSVVARNVAESGSWGYVPGTVSSGATSLLWTALLALNSTFIRLSPLAFTHILNAVFSLLFGQAFLRLVLREGYSLERSLAIAALCVVSGNVVWYAFLGMEPVLLLLLVTAGVLAIDGQPRWFARAGVCFGLAAALRPDALPACAIALAPFAIVRRSRREASLALLIVAVLYGVNLLAAHSLTGSAFPITLQGRRWLNQLPQHGPFAPLSDMADFIGNCFAFVGTNVLTLLKAPIAVFAPLLVATLVLIACGIDSSLRSTYSARADARGRFGHLVAFALAHTATYLLLFPTFGHGGRYQPFLAALALPVAWIGVDRCLARSRRAATVLQAALLCSCAFSLVAWRSTLAQGIGVIDGVHRHIGRVVAELPQNARVAAFDIGGIGYENRRPIVDLGGLVDRTYLPFMWSGTADVYLLEHQVDYVVLPEYYAPGHAGDMSNFFYRVADEFWAVHPSIEKRLGLLTSPRLQLERVAEAEARPQAYWDPALLTGLALPRQALYRVVRR